MVALLAHEFVKTGDEALTLLHRGDVDAIIWRADPEQISRDKKMNPGRITLYMACPHPEEESITRSELKREVDEAAQQQLTEAIDRVAATGIMSPEDVAQMRQEAAAALRAAAPYGSSAPRSQAP